MNQIKRNTLRELEETNFLHDLHKKLFKIDCIHFLNNISRYPNVLNTKYYKSSYNKIQTDHIKYIVYTSGLFDFYSRVYEEFKRKPDAIISAEYDNYKLWGFTNQQMYSELVARLYTLEHRVCIGATKISLDYTKNIFILMYDVNFTLPGITLN